MRRPRRRWRRRRRWIARLGLSTRGCSVLRRPSILSVLPAGKLAPRTSSHRPRPRRRRCLTRPAQASPTRARRLRSSRPRQRSHTSHRSPSSLLSTRSRVLLRRCRYGRRGCAKHRRPRPQQQATVTLQAFRHDVLRRADERFIPAPPDERLTPGARRGGVWCAARYGARQHGRESPLLLANPPSTPKTPPRRQQRRRPAQASPMRAGGDRRGCIAVHSRHGTDGSLAPLHRTTRCFEVPSVMLQVCTTVRCVSVWQVCLSVTTARGRVIASVVCVRLRSRGLT